MVSGDRQTEAHLILHIPLCRYDWHTGGVTVVRIIGTPKLLVQNVEYFQKEMQMNQFYIIRIFNKMSKVAEQQEQKKFLIVK